MRQLVRPVLGFMLTTLAITATAEVTTIASVKGRGDITVAPNGDLYVADFGTATPGSTITRVTPEGGVSIFVDGLPGSPAGIDFDADGNIIVASFRGNAVNRITPDGTVTPIAAINGIVGVTVTEEGEIFVAACNGLAVFRLPADGGFEVFSTGSLYACPNGLDQGHDGALYVVNFQTNQVVRVAEDGSTSLFATTPGRGNGHIVYRDGFYYVTSRVDNSVYGIDTAGNVFLVAGTGEEGNADGPATEATFAGPNGIALSPDGRYLYVASDSFDPNGDNALIRRIDLEGIGESFDANPGIVGAWLNPGTPGQGFLFDTVFSSDPPQLFAAWFTFDLAGGAKGFGAGGQRWFTAQGPIDGGTAELVISATTGGVFDDPAATSTDPVGTLTISFTSCTEGSASYAFDGGPSGSFPIERLTPDEVCAALTEQ